MPHATARLTALDIWTVMATLATTLATFAVALAAPTAVAVQRSGDQSTAAIGTLVSLAASMLMIGSYPLLASWITRTADQQRSLGNVVTMPRGVEWWGWFVPVACLVLPYLTMRTVTARTVPRALVLAWWLPWSAYWIASWIMTVVPFTGVDLTAEPLAPSPSLHMLVPLAWVSAACLAASWAFLTALVVRARRATD